MKKNAVIINLRSFLKKKNIKDKFKEGSNDIKISKITRRIHKEFHLFKPYN